jgi:hypothetical protein
MHLSLIVELWLGGTYMNHAKNVYTESLWNDRIELLWLWEKQVAGSFVTLPSRDLYLISHSWSVLFLFVF